MRRKIHDNPGLHEQRRGDTTQPLAANLSKEELQKLLAVLRQTPAEVVKEVGQLLMLLEAITRTGLIAGEGGRKGASGAGTVAWKSRSTSGRMVADMQEQGMALFTSARKQEGRINSSAQRTLRGGQGAWKGSGRDDEVERTKALRTWAVKCKRDVPSALQRLRSGASAMGQRDARILSCYAKDIPLSKARRVRHKPSEPGNSALFVGDLSKLGILCRFKQCHKRPKLNAAPKLIHPGFPAISARLRGMNLFACAMYFRVCR